MMRAVVGPAVVADAGAVTELVVARQSSLYGESAFSQADLEAEWSDLDLEQNARVIGDGERIVGYGAVQELGGIGYAEGYVHPRALRRPRPLHASPVRKQGVGAALLSDALGRFWQRGERRVGLGVDAANDTGAFRLYERAGMTPALGWVVYEQALGNAA